MVRGHHPALTSPRDEGGPARWTHGALFALLLALAAALLLAHRYPPLVDWPEHLAQDAVVARARDPSFGAAAYYRTTGWFLPYQGFRALHLALGALVGLGAGARLAWLGYLLGAPLAIAGLARRMGRDPFVAVASFTVLVEASVLWGFAPHALGTALLLAGLCLALDVLRAEPGGRARARTALLAALGVALFFTHAHQTLVWGASCTALALAARARGATSRGRALAVLVAVAPALALCGVYLAGAGWLSGAALADRFAVRGPVVWHAPWTTARLLPFSAGLTVMGYGPWCAYLAALSGVAIGARAQRRARRGGRGEPAAPAAWGFAGPVLCATWAALLFALPAEFRGQSVAPRLASVALLAALWVPRWEAPEGPREARAARPARALVALAAACALALAHGAFARFGRAFGPALDEVIARVPPRARVATLAYDVYAPGLRLPVALHLGGYVLAARGGMAATGFTRTGVAYRDEVPDDALLNHALWVPSLRGMQLDLARHGAHFDYVLVRRGRYYRGSPFAQRCAGGYCAARVYSASEPAALELWRIERARE